ncbi:hypothetical protein DFH28DRAFT_900058 [Melampsora americana]|nr:hypothetical protein DFH28DRAFT_900058 [Melampsora americana]
MSHSLNLTSTVLSNLTASHTSSNSTSSILLDPGPIYKSYTIGYFFIGFAITLASSLLNAFGINLQKLDLNRAQRSSKPTKDCLRPVWVLGLALYVISQVLGSTLALQYMRSEYVAPLGSTSLIFNFLFACWLLGTKITLRDVLGTAIVILGVVGVIGFGNIRQAGIDQEANMSLSTLQALWARPQWLLYLGLLEFTTLLTVWLASIAFELVQDKRDTESSGRGAVDDDEVDVERVLRRGGGRSAAGSKSPLSSIAHFFGPIIVQKDSLRNSLKQTIERWSMTRPDDTLLKLDGLLWGTAAGLLAGQTLVFAKSYVKLITNGFSHDGSGEPEDLAHPLSILICILLVVTSIFQVWCLNRGLKVYDSTLIVPVLFAIYTASGFINSLIYLHELPIYRSWVLFMIWICIAVLIFGVWMLSAKRPEPTKSQVKTLEDYSSTADPEGEAQHTTIGAHSDAGMSMLDKTVLFESLSSSSRIRKSRELRTTDPRSRSDSVMSLGELKDHLSDTLKSNRGLNPFEEFEIKPDQEVEEDEIDGLEPSPLSHPLPSYGEVHQHPDEFGVYMDAKSHIP